MMLSTVFDDSLNGWSLEYFAPGDWPGGTSKERSFATWGFSTVRRELRNQAIDRVTFEAPASAYDADPALAVGGMCVLRRAGQRWFLGRVIANHRVGRPDAERVRYELAGPWWFLEHRTFQQFWRVYDSGQAALIDARTSRLIPNQASDGTKLDLKSAAAAVLDYAVNPPDGAEGAPLAFRLAPDADPTITPDLVVPFFELSDQTCAEVLRRLLGWIPDAVSWFDYSEATPVLHIKRYAELDEVTLPASGGPVRSVALTPRDDLVVPAVVVKFEKTNVIDEVEYRTLEVDTAPANATGAELNAAVLTIDLEGARRTTVRQFYQTRSIDPASATWWGQHLHWLQNATNITISNGAREGGYPHELIKGAAQPWMASALNINSEKATVTATISCDISTPGGAMQRLYETPVAVRVSTISSGSTNGRTVRALLSSTAAEPTPAGMAEQLLAAGSVRHWSGAIELLEGEAGSSAWLGRRLNLNGGRAEWTTMRALVQRVTEAIDTGETEIVLGPPDHLDGGDLVAILRAQRGARTTWRRDMRGSGEASAGSTTEGGKDFAAGNSDAAPVYTKTVMALSSGGSTKTITLDAETPSIAGDDPQSQRSFVLDAAAAKLELRDDLNTVVATLDLDDVDPQKAGEIKLREMDICHNGAPGKALFFVSETYDGGGV